MSFYTHPRSGLQRFQVVLSSFLQHGGLPFADVLDADRIQQAFRDEQAGFGEGDDAVYTPAITLWAFLSQVLHKGEQRSCTAAVARVITLLVASGIKACAEDTGAYCRARAKLSESVLGRLTSEVSRECESQLPEKWLWHGRHVHLVDGTTVSMPDTPQNQAAYPQHTVQREGLGFPIARMVVLLSLATAMIGGMALGPYSGKETGETALFRELLNTLHPGEILLADRYYCSYFMIALLSEAGVDFVVRLHQLRTADFRRGHRLGKGDHVVVWPRPGKPDWMDEETYQRLPESITVREVHVHVHQKGFRVQSLVVVTTLTDATTYPTHEIAALYHKRWLVELDIRAIKISLDIDVLRCKSPAMVRKEIWTSLLAYNLIRRTMLQAAAESHLSPRQLSFTTALQKIAACWMLLLPSDDPCRIALISRHLGGLLKHRVDGFRKCLEECDRDRIRQVADDRRPVSARTGLPARVAASGRHGRPAWPGRRSARRNRRNERS